MKKLMIIGAGENQFSLIKEAKNMGCKVFVVSPAGNYPGIDVADGWLECDVKDTERIIEYAKKVIVDGVISDQSDLIAPIVAKVAETLNLPSYGYNNAICFTDKAEMRKVFEKIDIPLPRYYEISGINSAKEACRKIGYPVVLKPKNLFSSKGVSLVHSEYELCGAYDKAKKLSSKREVIVEKYITGNQYFSQGFVSDYHLNLFAFSDRYYHDIPGVFIPYTNVFPALIDNSMKELMKERLNRIVSYLRPKFGHVWAEWIVDDKTGELYIIEMAIRGAGAYVTTDIIPYAYGINTMPFLINESLGIEVGAFNNIEISNQKSAAFYDFLLPKGRIVDIRGIDEIKTLEGVLKCNINSMTTGEITRDIENKQSRYGYIIVGAENRNELEKVRKNIINTLKITVDTDEGERGIIWE